MMAGTQSVLLTAKAIVFLFFVLPIFFRNKFGSEDERKIKIKFIRTIFQMNFFDFNSIGKWSECILFLFYY